MLFKHRRKLPLIENKLKPSHRSKKHLQCLFCLIVQIVQKFKYAILYF